MSYLKEHDVHVNEEPKFSTSIVEVKNHLGTLQVTCCDHCSHVDVECLHENSSWDADERMLICDLCGEDAL